MKVRQAAGTFVCAVAWAALCGRPILAQVPPVNGGQPPYPVQPPYQVQQAAPQQPQAPLQIAQQPNIPAAPPAPPFVLSPQQQAELDRALANWETKSSQVKSFKCNFNHFKYDPTFAPPSDPSGPLTKSKGELYYAAPDKGMFREWDVITWQPNQSTRRLEQIAVSNGEWWACDGKSVYAVDVGKKEVTETPLPKEMQGQSITEGPLPFAFGAQAAKLKARYYIRLITPPERAQNEVWLEILPRWRQDAANFFKVEVILRASDMLPTAIRISTVQTKTGAYADVYLFEEKGFEWPDLSRVFYGVFSPSPLGYKHILQPVQGPNVTPPGGPIQPGGSTPPAGTSQARRPYDPSQLGPR